MTEQHQTRPPKPAPKRKKDLPLEPTLVVLTHLCSQGALALMLFGVHVWLYVMMAVDSEMPNLFILLFVQHISTGASFLIAIIWGLIRKSTLKLHLLLVLLIAILNTLIAFVLHYLY